MRENTDQNNSEYGHFSRSDGQNSVKKLKKLEKFYYRFWKAQIDLKFLINCNNNSLVPKFLNVCVATESLNSSRAYQQCQLTFLLEEIR